MESTIRLATGLVVAALFTSCAGSPGNASADENSAGVLASARSDDGLVMRIDPPAAASSAAGFEVSLSVENRGDAPVTLRFTSGQRFDLQALRDGESVWTWSASRSFIQALGEETVEPGESLLYVVDVPGAAIQPGSVRLAATLTSSSHPLSVSADLEVGS